jgi:hypothetical protein
MIGEHLPLVIHQAYNCKYWFIPLGTLFTISNSIDGVIASTTFECYENHMTQSQELFLQRAVL